MSKSSTASSRSRSGTFPSPGTPSYTRSGAAATSSNYPNGWASERVPLATASNNRRSGGGGGGVLLPFNNGRKLPSKWEDAEKWILSPVSSDGGEMLRAPPPPHHRRPKSKSGPLGHPSGIPGGFLSASPVAPCMDTIFPGAADFGAISSPFSTGVLMADQKHSFALGNGGMPDGRRRRSGGTEPAILRSSSMHALPDVLTEPSSSMHASEDATQDDEVEITIQADPVTSSPVIKKDAATQMSPEGSSQSPPKQRRSFSHLPRKSTQDVSTQVTRLEVRDVPVDDQVTVTRRSKRHATQASDKRSASTLECPRSGAAPVRAPSFDERETARCISMCKREEAKITAWENLQRAKAEAAIRKLEMRLEKKRSSSMDKILSKLRAAQKRAQDMRTTVSSNREQCGSGAKTASRSPGRRKIAPFGSCFSCLAC